MTESVDCVVVGAGVVGLAVARALAMSGREVVIVEKEGAIGTGISSRNSEVIHAGLYYAPGSLKATLCVSGRALLYEYCVERNISHRRCGKLVVATAPEELPTLHTIQANARSAGVLDLELISSHEARAMEPELACAGALFSPSSGIVDSHALMLALLADAEAHGALLALKSEVISGSASDSGVGLFVAGETSMDLVATTVVNCAGLYAQRVAQAIATAGADHIPPALYAKGNYFSLVGTCPFERLIYPVPEPGGLGVHLTIDLGGQAKFGPDVEWIDDIDYQVNASRAAAFEREVRKYWPGLPVESLAPAYAGIRPKLKTSGNTAADFCIVGPREHGARGLYHLFGIESPGLTSSLALGAFVSTRIARGE